MSTTVKVIWKCNKPRDRAIQQLCEKLMTQAALKYGMDTAIIRKEPHNTTRAGRTYVKTDLHITGDIVNNKDKTRYAIHYNLDTTLKPLPDLPDKPNPQVWEVKYEPGEESILAKAGRTEIENASPIAEDKRPNNPATPFPRQSNFSAEEGIDAHPPGASSKALPQLYFKNTEGNLGTMNTTKQPYIDVEKCGEGPQEMKEELQSQPQEVQAFIIPLPGEHIEKDMGEDLDPTETTWSP